jgi:hypothetical protein
MPSAYVQPPNVYLVGEPGLEGEAADSLAECKPKSHDRESHVSKAEVALSYNKTEAPIAESTVARFLMSF